MPYKCNWLGCTKAFNQAGRLSIHKKMHHSKPKKREPCIFLIEKVNRTELEPIVQLEEEEELEENKESTV